MSQSTRPGVSRADIAEIYEALGDPRAPLARLLADDEHAETCGYPNPDATAALDRLWAWLDDGQLDGDKVTPERKEIVTEVRRLIS